MRRVVFLVMAMTSLTLGAATPTAAAAPAIEHDRDLPLSFTIADCGAFQIVGTWIVSLRTATFVDQSGTAIREDFTAHWHGAIANSASGKSVDDSGSFSTITDLTTGLQTERGVVRHDTVPGTGLIWLDTGRVDIDGAGNVTFATPHADTPPTQACTYFGS